MKSAAEWVEHMRDSGHFYCESEGAATLAAAILARDIEVLEEAAKSICVDCARETPLLEDERGRYHLLACGSHSARMVCKALTIHDLIAELKKGMADDH